MELVQIVGIIFAAVVILTIAYLYRESQRISGKAKVEAAPEDKVQKEKETEPEPANK